MAYDAGTAFLQVVPSFDGVVTAISAQAQEWGDVTGRVYKEAFQSQVQDLKIDVGLGGIASTLAEIEGVKAAAGAAAGGGGGMGLIGALLWGTGGIAGFAAFGSAMSLAGFGAEHLLTTIIGLAGSLAGALAGGALLAAGALGVLAVGMGSDLAVSMSAIADIETLSTAYTAQQTAILQYGAGSAQAAAATAALNLQVQLLGNTLGVLAELQLAKALSALNAYWDQATSGARVAFVNMVTPLLSIAYTYIPLVAAAATRNFGLIQKGLAPLIAYINGPATAVFSQLENLFAQRLPTAMNALNQGVQLLIKTIALVAPQTGGLLTSISNFLTKMNTPAGFAAWSKDVGKLIFMFHTWWDLLKQVAITIFDLFDNSKGLGTGIVTALTSMLKQLDKWLTSINGKNAVGNLFEVHKKEVIDLLKALGPLIVAFGEFYLAVSPLVISAIIPLILGLTKLFDLIAKSPITAFVGGFLILLATSKSLRTVLGFIAGPIRDFVGALLALDPATWLFVGIALAIVGVGVALVNAYTHFKAFRDVVDTVVGNVISAWDHLVSWVNSETAGLARWLHAHWAQITDDASIAWNIVSTFVKIAWEVITTIIHDALLVIIPILQVAWSVIFNAVTITWTIVTTTIRDAVLAIIDVVHGVSAVVGFLVGVWQTVTTDIYNAWSAVTTWFKDLPGRIVSAIGTATNILYQVGKDIITGLWNGITSVATWLKNNIGGLAGDVAGWAKSVLGISSPSTVFHQIGVDIGQGLADGLLASTARVKAAGQGMLSGLTGPGDLGLLANPAIMASVGVSGAVSLSGMEPAITGQGAMLAALQRIEAAVTQVAPGVSTKVDAKMSNVIRQHAKTSLTLARTGAH